MSSTLFIPNKTRLHAENSSTAGSRNVKISLNSSVVSLGAVEPPDLTVIQGVPDGPTQRNQNEPATFVPPQVTRSKQAIPFEKKRLIT
ncbi:hypothetical protein AVEN_256526-1 [Araneus ventricosus]|uniref:Uncharacterized protein n=1 Tax=Araneus ventricosus TaxID=182803 RepID=A0A4Y2K638_ARAVE|nr:hypothetical protein AVEN_256526-1 [Araneus ventricosus]